MWCRNDSPAGRIGAKYAPPGITETYSEPDSPRYAKENAPGKYKTTRSVFFGPIHMIEVSCERVSTVIGSEFADVQVLYASTEFGIMYCIVPMSGTWSLIHLINAACVVRLNEISRKRKFLVYIHRTTIAGRLCGQSTLRGRRVQPRSRHTHACQNSRQAQQSTPRYVSVFLSLNSCI